MGALVTPARAPAKRLDPRFQFVEVKGFGQIVIAAGIQPGNPVAHRRARGKHQDRRFDIAAAHALQQVQTILARDVQIKKDQIVLLLFDQLKCGQTIKTGRHSIATLLQRPHQRLGHIPIIFNNKNFHE